MVHLYQFPKLRHTTDFFFSSPFSGVTFDCPDVHALCRQQVVEFPKDLLDTRRSAAFSAEASSGDRCFLLSHFHLLR